MKGGFGLRSLPPNLSHANPSPLHTPGIPNQDHIPSWNPPVLGAGTHGSPCPWAGKGKTQRAPENILDLLGAGSDPGDPLEMREWGTHPARNSKAVGNCCSMAQEGALPANNEKNNYVHC